MAKKTRAPEAKPQSRILPIIAVTTAAVVVVGYLYVRHQQRDLRRELVQTILSIGGEVTFDYHWKKGHTFPQRAEYRKEGADDSNAIYDSLPVGFVDLSRLKVPVEIMQAVARLPQIRSLNLNDAQLDDEAWEIFSRLDNAEGIWIGGEDCTPERMVALRRLSGVRSLWIRDTRLTEASCQAIASLNSLEELDLAYVKFDNASLAPLSKLRHLKSFSLRAPSEDSEFNDQTLGFLAGLIELTDLNITACPVGSDGLRHIATLVNLEGIILQKVPIDDRALMSIASLSSLKNLMFAGTKVTGEVPDCFERLTELETLNFIDSPVTDRTLKHLYGLENLRTVRLVDTEVTEQGKKLLSKALPEVQVVGRELPKPRE